MSDATDVSGGFNQVGGTGRILPPVSTDVPVVPKRIGFTDKDTISKAAIDAAMMMQFVSTAQYPVLMVPIESDKVDGATGESLALKTAAKFHEIATSILDAWSESIKKIAEERIRKENDPDTIAQLNEERRQRLGLVDNFKSAFHNEIERDNAKNVDTLSFVTSSLVIASAGVVVGIGVMDVVSTSQVAMIPQMDSLGSLAAQTVGMFPGDTRAELGLLGALMMSGAFYAANAEQVADKQAGKVVDQVTLATNYANKILKLVGSDQLESLIRDVLGERYNPASAAMVKVVMLTSALAALYKSSTKWITGQELTDLVKGKLAPSNKLEEQLVQNILVELSKMSATQQETVLTALGRYMDTNPKFESFFDISDMMDKLAENITTPPEASMS